MNSDRAALLSSVRSQMERFAETQDPSAILSDQALADATTLLETTPDITADLEVAHIVGWLHWCRYLVLPAGSDRQDFDAALTLLTPVWRAVPESVPEALRRILEDGPDARGDTPGLKADQAVMILRKLSLSSQPSDVSAAIDLLRQSLSAAPPADPNRAVRLANLATALRLRFEQSGSVADLDESVQVAQDAAATPADNSDRSLILINLATSLRLRFEQSGSVADLDQAIAVAREAVAATPAAHPSRADRLSDLATALRLRFGFTGDAADLNESVQEAREAVAAAPDDHPDRAVILSNLSTALQARFEITGSTSDLDEAVTAGRTAASLSAASPGIRARAARAWASAAAAHGDWDQAVTAYSTAVAQLPALVPRDLGRRERERRLLEVAGLGSQAAAASLQAGQAERAVELFEHGRGLLLGQALDMSSYPKGLDERHPELAERFTMLTSALREEMPAADAWLGDEPPVKGDFGRHQDIEQRSRLAAEFDSVVAEIRALPGFGEFLRPAGIGQLRSAAADGPVVLINVSSLRSDALIISPEQVDIVSLPMLDPQTVKEKAAEFHKAIGYGQASEGTRQDRLRAEQDLLEVLGWLWDALAEPVLGRLGMTSRPELGQEWPRLWWCPSGVLSFFPVHAAGHHETRDNARPLTVIDRVVSSYTPTLRILADAQREARPSRVASGEAGALLVAVPDAPGVPELPGAAEEVRRVHQLLGEDAYELIGNMATSERFLSILPECRLLHLACHSFNDLDDPSASRILLYDHQEHPITAFDIARLHLEKAELAFLSTSGTNVSSSALADEAIDLSSAFQLAGFRQVIGSLWSVADLQSAGLARDVYRTLISSRLPGLNAAHALHQAVRRQRDQWPSTPSLWACHVHTGV